MSSYHRPRLYLAYGSNLNLRQMEYRCPTAAAVGPAMLRDYELLFRSVATVEPKPGGRVPVLLWDITRQDEQALDAYEGWPHLYRKENMFITLNGKPVRAMAYIMNDGQPLSPPGRSYYNTILQGYKSAGFDRRILDAAVHESAIRFEEPKQDFGFDNMNFWR